MGGQGDKRRLPITEIGRQHPPTTSRLELDNYYFLEFELGQAGKKLEAGDDKRPPEQQEETAAREDRDDFRR